MKTKKLSDIVLRIAFSKGQEFAEETAYRGKFITPSLTTTISSPPRYDSENNRRIELAFLYGALGETFENTKNQIEKEL